MTSSSNWPGVASSGCTTLTTRRLPISIRLILIAHAETSATRRAAFALDEEIDARGRAALAHLAPPRCDRALTSPATAARQTAAALGLAAEDDAALADLATGAWAGRTLAEVAAADPTGVAAFVADPAFDGHGGESIAALLARVQAWLEARRAARGRLAAVSHPAVLRAAVVAVTGAPASAFWRIDVAPLATVGLTSDGRRWALRMEPGASAD